MSESSPATQPAAIELADISKVYRLYSSPRDRLKEALHPRHKKYYKDFFALKDVSFSVPRGQTYGIIGLNGSGKSTLLKIICGVTQPTTGWYNVKGRISALLELGAGFNPEFTGRENVYFSGVLAGFDRSQIEERYDDIVRFANIGEYIDQPVKNYSSGMLVRLAFAVSIHVDPDILVIDEALSVGDARFQQKCMAKIQEFKNKCTILFVTHDVSAIVAFCDRALWLHQGELMNIGTPNEVVNQYIEAVYEGTDKESSSPEQACSSPEAEDPLQQWDPSDAFGAEKARIHKLQWLVGGRMVENVHPGDDITFNIWLKADETVALPVVGFIIKNRLGLEVTTCNNLMYGQKLPPLAPGVVSKISFRFKWPNLAKGPYSITVALAEGTLESHRQHHWINDALIVHCIQPRHVYGIFGLNRNEVEISCKEVNPCTTAPTGE